ncbi:hypothetical protein [Paucidesulfovibrio longus]|uniref:hypothetical protein n=1 Tax=Paucidesulfovibrio longus TaxID=889 RepID=UPI0003B51B37|nr:hypothetical protein [Paucidesulfovibrio longus]
MKRIIPSCLLFFGAAAALLAVAALAPARSAFAVQPVSGTEVVNAQFIAARCGDCHAMDKTCSKLGKKDRNAWLGTVKRMVETRGADISPATAKGVADFLFQPDPALNQLCGK